MAFKSREGRAACWSSKYERELRRFLQRCGCREQDAGDLTQEVHLRLLHTAVPKEPLPRLYKIAHEVLERHQREEKERKQYAIVNSRRMEAAADAHSYSQFCESLRDLDRRERFQDGLEELPDRSREVLTLSVENELPRGIAQKLGRPLTSVRKAYSRGKAQLRSMKRSGRLKALGLAVLLGVAITFGIFRSDELRLETTAGEWRTQALSDGTSVTLGPRTALSVRYTLLQRSIHLGSGEAMFLVAKNALRPFVVDAQGVSTRAVGTSFAMSADAERGVTVTVKEGRVAVTLARHAGETIALEAGEQLSTDKMGHVEVRQVDIATAFAWTDKRIVFENTTIAEAVDQFNRRNIRQTRIDFPEVARRQLSGSYFVNDPESFMRTLVRKAEFTVLEDDAGNFVITRGRAEIPTARRSK